MIIFFTAIFYSRTYKLCWKINTENRIYALDLKRQIKNYMSKKIRLFSNSKHVEIISSIQDYLPSKLEFFIISRIVFPRNGLWIGGFRQLLSDLWWGQNRRNRLKGETHQTEENPTTAQPPPFSCAPTFSCAPPFSGSFRRLPPNHHSNTLRFLAGVDALQPLPFCGQHQTHLTLHLTLLAGSMPSFYQQLSPVPPCRQPFSVTVGNKEIGQLMNLFIWFI